MRKADSAQKLEGERLKCFALSISMQTKAIDRYSFSLKVKLGYILGQKLEDKR